MKVIYSWKTWTVARGLDPEPPRPSSHAALMLAPLCFLDKVVFSGRSRGPERDAMVGVARKEPLSRRPCHRPTMPFSAWRRSQKSACEDGVQPCSLAHPRLTPVHLLPDAALLCDFTLAFRNIFFYIFFFFLLSGCKLLFIVGAGVTVC